MGAFHRAVMRFFLSCLDNKKRRPYDFIVQGQTESAWPSKLLHYEGLYDWEGGNWWSPIPGKDNPWPGSSELEVGRFLYSFCMMTRSTSILETGACFGYSTCCMAMAVADLGGGRVTTIDPDPQPKLWENIALKEHIHWIQKYSQDSLPDLEQQQFDVMLLDSDHAYETISWEVTNLEPLLKVGGYLLLHDSEICEGVARMCAELREDPRFDYVSLNTPRDCGLAVVRKLQ
jgi:predicted O-methyltransferase YrrM